ncbi:MAG TPA: hypothetical protein VEF35_04305 [Candidatus Bathyarchaeia archaeon]|nr:hypothetical protein [Candidatus Bathyarchaeia archaeon]
MEVTKLTLRSKEESQRTTVPLEHPETRWAHGRRFATLKLEA